MRTLLVSIAVLATAFTLNSCLKKGFSAPPDVSSVDPNVPVNLTIAQLKAEMGNATQRIDSDWTIYGIVNADDRTGNLYKQINIEDSTGGITILIDAYSLYTKYPVGRKVYVRLKGLYYGFYSKFPQLGYAPDYTGSLNNIPGSAADNFIIGANYPNVVSTTSFTDLAAIKTVNTSMLGRLVEIDNVQVIASDTSKTYSDSLTASNITLEDCSGNKIVIRTSNFANFHSVNVPKGKGKIVALYTNFNTTPQLVIRDTTDLQLYDVRCDGTAPPAPALISIDSMRKMYPGSGSFNLPAAQITGVVISDINKKNVPSGNFIIEDASRKGVVLYISGSSTYKLGDSLLINLAGGRLELYPAAGSGSVMELTGLSASKISKVGSNRSVSPTILTIAQLNANFSEYESTLVKIMNATISGSGSYSGNKALADGTGTISLYTAPAATFSGDALPSGSHNVTGIATPYSQGNELKLRNPAIDVQ